MSKPRTQQQRREAATQSVLESACFLFGEQGYQGTSLECIADRAGMTIRPIYHYFGNKEQLFLAVTEQMEQRLYAAMQEIEAGQNGPVLGQYWEVFMQFGRDPQFRQIVLVDAPVVLGRERWADSPVVQQVIDILVPLFPGLLPETRHLIAQMVIAALTEVAMSLAEPGNKGKEHAFEEISGLIRMVLESVPGGFAASL
ncbi:MAG: TetR/AcrR family transcriptional regulator [Ketobacter sp.]|nr:MAG: TetR/AcrR family transcriptional regulator [Ketobacter sp.]